MYSVKTFGYRCHPRWHRVDDTGRCAICGVRPRKRSDVPRDTGQHDAMQRGLSAPDQRTGCGPRAVALAAGIPFAEADAMCREWGGRRDGTGTYGCDLFKALGIAPVYSWVRERQQTLGALLKAGRMARGRFVIATCNHLVAVIDGKVTDRTSARARVRYAWKVAD